MANLVTSGEILPLIQPLLNDVDVELISDSSTISLTKFTTSNRVALRAAVEKTLSNNNITFEDLPKSLGGSFGGTEIYTYDMKKVRFQYKPPQGGGARGGKRIADLGECSPIATGFARYTSMFALCLAISPCACASNALISCSLIGLPPYDFLIGRH